MVTSSQQVKYCPNHEIFSYWDKKQQSCDQQLGCFTQNPLSYTRTIYRWWENVAILLQNQNLATHNKKILGIFRYI